MAICWLNNQILPIGSARSALAMAGGAILQWHLYLKFPIHPLLRERDRFLNPPDTQKFDFINVYQYNRKRL